MIKQVHEVISPEYAEANQTTHRGRFGHKGDKWLMEMLRLYTLTERHLGEPPTWLDYGCGKNSLAKAFERTTLPCPHRFSYDPGHPDYAVKPDGKFDVVTATDVLEHVEPDRLDAVLEDILGYTKYGLFANIATVDTAVTLPDGRSAHLTVQPAEWWIERLSRAWNIGQLSPAYRLDYHVRSKEVLVWLTHTNIRFQVGSL